MLSTDFGMHLVLSKQLLPFLQFVMQTRIISFGLPLSPPQTLGFGTHGVRMQHGEELWADEELHGGRL